MIPTLSEARARVAAATRALSAVIAAAPAHVCLEYRLARRHPYVWDLPDNGPVHFPPRAAGFEEAADGECPACSGFVRLVAVREAHHRRVWEAEAEVDVARRLLEVAERPPRMGDRARWYVTARRGPAEVAYLAGPFCAPEEAARLVPAARHALAAHYPRDAALRLVPVGLGAGPDGVETLFDVRDGVFTPAA